MAEEVKLFPKDKELQVFSIKASMDLMSEVFGNEGEKLSIAFENKGQVVRIILSLLFYFGEINIYF